MRHHILASGGHIRRRQGDSTAVYINGRFEPRLILPLSLSYDHRVIDGAEGLHFVRWIAKALEKPFLLAGRNARTTNIVKMEIKMDIFEFAMEKEKFSEDYYRRLAEKTNQSGLRISAICSLRRKAGTSGCPSNEPKPAMKLLKHPFLKTPKKSF